MFSYTHQSLEGTSKQLEENLGKEDKDDLVDLDISQPPTLLRQ